MSKKRRAKPRAPFSNKSYSLPLRKKNLVTITKELA